MNLRTTTLWLISIAAAILAGGGVGVAPTARQAAAAEEKGPYQPMGAPADPKVAAHWNRYHDYAEATQLLKALGAAHSGRGCKAWDGPTAAARCGC
jgi:hypothetical protein